MPGARQVVDAGAGLVDHHQRVDPDVAFGVPLGLLRAPDQRQQLREQARDDLEVERERQPQRGSGGAQQELLDLAPDTLGRQVVEWNAGQQRPRLRVDLKSKSCDELHGAQHAQAVVAEVRRIDDAQAPGLQVGAAVERVVVFAGQGVQADGVDREVAPACRVGKRHARVALDREAAMSAARLRLAPGQRDVDGADLVHGKALAHRFDPPEAREQSRQIRGGDAEDLQIEILGVEAEQPVAHEPAHDPGAATGLGHRRRNRARRFERLVVRCHARCYPALPAFAFGYGEAGMPANQLNQRTVNREPVNL